MDGSAFDQLSRRFAAFGSRRRAVKAFAGAVAGVVVGGRATVSAGCTQQYRSCQSDGQCCAGAVCQSGICQPGCRIGGVFRSASTPQPGNTCARCTPAISTTEWSAANEGMACWSGAVNLCGGPTTCQAGICQLSNLVTCQPLTACHVAGECNPNTGLCSNPPAEAGLPCGGGDICAGGFYTPPLRCDGSGFCVGGATVPCYPYACGAGGCLTSCASDVECAPGLLCFNGACRTPVCGNQRCEGTGFVTFDCSSGSPQPIFRACADGTICRPDPITQIFCDFPPE